jgi:hypothetical protein
MIRRSKAKCKHPKCIEIATYGGTNFIPLRCEEHKQDDDLNLLERACVKCGLTMILDATNQCEFCAPDAFKRAALAKQNVLMDYLDARKDLPTPMSTDTIIDGGACGKERPDRIYDLDDKIIVVECDENQHKERACECEQTRMVNIGQSFGGIPVYFIRWNPDIYSPENDKKQPEAIQSRYKLLGDLIRDIKRGKFSVPSDALVSAFYLYYDDWDGLHSQKWHTLTPLVARGGAGF